MDRRFLQEISPLIKNTEAWKALLLILEHQKINTVKKLIGKPGPEELLRISGEYEALAKLERFQEIALQAEKDL